MLEAEPRTGATAAGGVSAMNVSAAHVVTESIRLRELNANACHVAASVGRRGVSVNGGPKA